MPRRLLFRPLGVLLGSFAFVAGCSSKPAVQTAAAPAATPTIVTLEPPPAAPAPAPVPAPAPAADALPTSLDELNRRGYLKDAFFDFDRAEIATPARGSLEGDAKWLRAHPTIIVRVEGHADERGTAAYNLALGERRAAAVREYLSSLGVDPVAIQTVSYGKERPFVTGHDEADWAQNRRGHFVVTAR
jgi:peptidoglycan-associated lipoprotein